MGAQLEVSRRQRKEFVKQRSLSISPGDELGVGETAGRCPSTEGAVGLAQGGLPPLGACAHLSRELRERLLGGPSSSGREGAEGWVHGFGGSRRQWFLCSQCNRQSQPLRIWAGGLELCWVAWLGICELTVGG